MTRLAAVENTRMSDAWVTFLASEKSWATTEDQLPSTHPIAADVVDLETVLVNFDGITYGKGASVLRQLVAWVGQEEFLAGVPSILPSTHGVTPPWQICWPELEGHSGRDLTEWTKLWLEESGVNVLSPVIEVADDDIVRRGGEFPRRRTRKSAAGGVPRRRRDVA